jgi:hypothetical protein
MAHRIITGLAHRSSFNMGFAILLLSIAISLTMSPHVAGVVEFLTDFALRLFHTLDIMILLASIAIDHVTDALNTSALAAFVR